MINELRKVLFDVNDQLKRFPTNSLTKSSECVLSIIDCHEF